MVEEKMKKMELIKTTDRREAELFSTYAEEYKCEMSGMDAAPDGLVTLAVTGGSKDLDALEERVSQVIEKTQMQKAAFYTNSMYLMADMANSMAMEAERIMEGIGKHLQADKKAAFRAALKAAKYAANRTRKVAGEIYDIEDAAGACDDSDYLYNMFLLVVDRTGDDPEDEEAMLEHIRELPSNMHLGEFLGRKL